MLIIALKRNDINIAHLDIGTLVLQSYFFHLLPLNNFKQEKFDLSVLGA